MVNFGQAAVGIIVLLVVAVGFLYLFYSRTNAVEKTGYGALAMLSIVSIMIPIFWIRETGFEASQANTQETTAITSGMQLYAQYCVFQCYAVRNSKLVTSSLKYNGYTMAALNQLSDQDLQRVIEAGIYNPQAPMPPTADDIPESQTYGGPLDANQIQYIFQLIRSADPAYMKKQGYPSSVGNGFSGLLDYVQNNYPAQYQDAVNLGTNGQFGTPVDDTKLKTVALSMVNPPAGAACTPSCFGPINVMVKVGTVITWTNNTSVAHTVTALSNTDPTVTPKPDPQIFDSGNDPSKYVKSGATYTYTVTMAAYNLDPTNHRLYYFCRIHPTMLAELVITK
jgi:plastocyanin